MSFAAVIGLIGLLLAAEPEKPNQSQQSNNTVQNCTVYYSARNNEPGREKQGNREQNECIFKIEPQKDALDYVAIGFGFLFTAALVGIGALQVHWMGKTYEATNSAARAADESAQATKESVKVTIIIQRAYLSVVFDQPNPLMRVDQSITARFSIVNNGASQARIISYGYKFWDAIGWGSPSTPSETKTEIILGAKDTFVFETKPYSFRPNFTDEFFYDPMRKFAIEGSITYLDIFNETHRTRFCRLYEPTVNNFVHPTLYRLGTEPYVPPDCNQSD